MKNKLFFVFVAITVLAVARHKSPGVQNSEQN